MRLAIGIATRAAGADRMIGCGRPIPDCCRFAASMGIDDAVATPLAPQALQLRGQSG